MEITFRDAVPEDYEQISEIFSEMDLLHAKALPQVFKKPKTPLRSRRHIAEILSDPTSTIIIAESGEKILGLVQVMVRDAPAFPVFHRRRYGWIETFAVREAFRRRGVGRKLMRRALDWAKAGGAETCELNVWEFNRDAIEFYNKLGYRTASRRMWTELI